MTDRPQVVLYTAPGCHLCDLARETIGAVRDEVQFDLREIDITGDDDLERRYRVLLPVVEIDGTRAFVFEVEPDAFRRKLAGSS